MSRWGPRGDSGFTVVEFVVAAAILLIVSVSVMSALVFAATSTTMNAQRQAATSLANERIEYARNVPYDDLGVTYAGGGYGDPPGPIITPEQVGNLTVETDITWARDPVSGRATYKQVSVSVSWDEPRASTMTFETNVYGSSSLVNTGDVLVTVLDNDTFEPIEGGLVSIDPSSGVSRQLQTNDRGEAFFGFVPSGDVDIDVQVTGYLVDLTGVQDARVQSDSLNQYVVYAQLASTGIVRVVDSGGNPISDATVVIESDGGVTTSIVTGADGLATFTGLMNGMYTVVASAPGRVDGHGMFEITSGGQTVTIEVSLADLGTLSVTVLHGSTGSPIEGATVQVRGPAPAINEIDGSPAATASSGEAAFEITDNGTYTVSVSMAGFEPASTVVEAVVGMPTSVEVSLTPIQHGSLRVWTLRPNGNSEGNIPIQVYRQVGAAWQMVFDGTTNASGFHDLTELEPGEYAARRERWPRGWRAWVFVTVAAGEQSVVVAPR